MARSGRGRQKIEMAKVKEESNLQVTFSKRRTGLFKKANELSVLCGAEVALIAFSPGEKVYSYGQPSVESILERFHHETSSPVNIINPSGDHHECVIQADRNAELALLEKRMEDAKKHRKALQKGRKEHPPGQQYWWKRKTEELDLNELMVLKKAMEGMCEKLEKKCGGRVLGSRPFGVAEEQEEIEMSRTTPSSGSGSPASGDGDRKPIRVHQFI